MAKKIYLDYAAATPMDPKVLAVMEPYFSERFYNPSATYLAAQAIADDIATARSQAAHWLGSRPSEIVFTAGGTEANNLALAGVMAAFPEANLLVSAIEHESIINPAAKHPHKVIKVLPDGRVDIADLVSKVDNQTVLVSVMYANNEIGTIEPIREIAKKLQEIRRERQKLGNKLPLYFHTDACQAAAYLDLHTSRLGVDLMTINGGKIYGPKQSGALYVKTGTKIQAQILGGGQERGLRSGTENVAGTIGLSKALDLVQNRRQAETERIKQLQGLFISKLEELGPKVSINGSRDHRLPNNVHVTFSGQDNERLMMALDEVGIQCAVGSACSASNEEPSHVLMAIGLSETQAQASLRFSLGRQTTVADIRLTSKAIAQLL
ncbi:MAG TPA: cysteine desulfurase family protein [Patescibacteria group bacterium]|nr:cysteine desulfurase family protein [Patescibacteria group bacterium]